MIVLFILLVVLLCFVWGDRPEEGGCDCSPKYMKAIKETKSRTGGYRTRWKCRKCGAKWWD